MGYEASSRLVFKELGMNLVDIPDFSCCAPGFIKEVNIKSSNAISARNLAIAEEKNLDILTFCSGCFSNLKKTLVKITENEEELHEINEILQKINKKFQGKTKVFHGLEYLKNYIGFDQVKKRIKNSFKGFILGSFHGCHICRPSEILKFEDPDYPKSLDELISLMDGTNLDYEGKYDCCGGTIKNLMNDISLEILRMKLKSLKNLNADAVVVACPFCFYQFDAGQKEILKVYNEKYEIPVLSFTDIIGLSMDLPRKNLGLNTHRIKLKKFLQKFDEINGIES